MVKQAGGYQMWYLLAAADILIIAAGMAVASLSGWWIVLGVLIVGIGQHRLALMAHDAAHGHSGSDIVARLVFAPFGIGLDSYRGHHFLHHRAVGTPQDPELTVKNHHRKQWKFQPTYPVKYFLTDCLGLGADNILWVTIEFWSRASKKDAAVVMSFWVFILTACLLTGGWWVLLLWELSLVTTFWAVFRQRMFTEHVEVWVGHTTKYSASWWEKITYLPHNTDLHLEHHDRPAVPCWKLKRVP
jgi:fatty acid desaturase